MSNIAPTTSASRLLRIDRVLPANVLASPVEQAEEVLQTLGARLRAAGLDPQSSILYATFQFRQMSADFLAINNGVINKALPLGLARASVEVDDLPPGAAFAIAGVIAASDAAARLERLTSALLVKPLPVYAHIVRSCVATHSEEEVRQTGALVTSCIQGFVSTASFDLPESLGAETAQAAANLISLLAEGGFAWMVGSDKHRIKAVHTSSQPQDEVRAALAAAVPGAKVELEAVKTLPRGCRVALVFRYGIE